MLEPDAGFSIKHDKTPSPAPASTSAPTPAPTPTPAPAPAAAPANDISNDTITNDIPTPMPRPTVAGLKQAFAEQMQQTAPEPSAPAPAPQNIQTIQTSDPNFVVTKNLDADSVFATAAPTASFADLTEKKPEPEQPTDAPARPAIEISNPMAPRSLFEEEKPTTPSVAFNDPAAAPDAPRPGTDPEAKKGINANDIKRLTEKLNTTQVKNVTESAKSNPMRMLLIVSSIIIVLLIIAIAFVS